MFNQAIKILEIKRDLEEIPEARLADVNRYVKSLIRKRKQKAKQPQTLKGIWANKGFERISDTDEIILSRKELGKLILSKKI